MKLDVIYNKDCLEGMKRLPDESIDLIVTDPPYGIAYKQKNKPYMIGDLVNCLDYALPEFYRVLKKKGAIYIFTSFKMLDSWLHRFQMFFKMHNLIIWDKQRNSGLQMGSNYGFRYEMIFFGSKGLHKLNGYCDDILDYARVKKRKHPTEKPVELIKKFIEMSSKEKDIVLDPFIGSGTTAVACRQLGRHYIGYEINKEYCEIAKQRLANIKGDK
ncbi:site-specific DNA-methyltransferase [candidate division Kazan bacterium]|uniref:Methyltransferase n=1 Tax=candidate division Kazan bacterium TaxID=2202143 RepID=A0A420ZCC5_UNCK3|nr:MAG: site-specific DNA-methyltransferase [candidate division Kazan bacterium]